MPYHAISFEPGHEKMCLVSYANNKGADQPAQPRSLISTFVVCCLDSIISLDSIAEISRLASFCGCAGRFVSGLVGKSQRHVFSWRGSFIIACPPLGTKAIYWKLIKIPKVEILSGIIHLGKHITLWCYLNLNLWIFTPSGEHMSSTPANYAICPVPPWNM